jgi:hypothetical protein
VQHSPVCTGEILIGSWDSAKDAPGKPWQPEQINQERFRRKASKIGILTNGDKSEPGKRLQRAHLWHNDS